jgi:hypothetical protein
MEFVPPATPVKRKIAMRFIRGEENWTLASGEHSFEQILVEFEQNEHTLTLYRVMGFGTVGQHNTRYSQIFSLDNLPVWVNDLAVTARTVLHVQITGRLENPMPEFPENWTDEKRKAYYNQQMADAVYAVIAEGRPKEELIEEYNLDYTLEAQAAMRVSNQENIWMQAEIDRLSNVVEILERENKRLRDVEDVCDKMSALVSEKFDAETEQTKAIKAEITKLGIRCYARLRQISQLVNNRAINREPYVATDELFDILKDWNALGARKVEVK